MPNPLDRILTEMSGRLAELRPLVDEQRRLEQALRALGADKQCCGRVGRPAADEATSPIGDAGQAP